MDTFGVLDLGKNLSKRIYVFTYTKYIRICASTYIHFALVSWWKGEQIKNGSELGMSLTLVSTSAYYCYLADR